MPHYASLTFLDATGEKTNTNFPHGAITAANLPGYLTAYGTFRAAVEGITRGTLHKERIVMDDTLISNSIPANPDAQREDKILVVYRDTTTNKKYTLTIGTLDRQVVQFVPGGGDAIDLTAPAAVATFVSEFQAFCHPPDAPANAVEIVQMRVVGRNI